MGGEGRGRTRGPRQGLLPLLKATAVIEESHSSSNSDSSEISPAPVAARQRQAGSKGARHSSSEGRGQKGRVAWARVLATEMERSGQPTQGLGASF